MYDLIIIGAGPAGLCAGVYAARKQLKTLLISGDTGGQMNNAPGIENWLGYQFIKAPELVSQFEQHVAKFPIDRQIGPQVTSLKHTEAGFEAATDDGQKYRSRTVLLATGKRSRRLGVPGEQELVGRGVSYCAICDGPVFAGQRVAIIGGGNSAVSAAIDMLKIAEHVDLVSTTQLTADPVLVKKISGHPKLDTWLEYQVTGIEGDTLVAGLGVRPVKGGKEIKLAEGGVFIEIGLEPNAGLVKDMVPLNKRGEVPVSCDCETTMPGLYAAGDVTDVVEKQIIIAAGEGAKAALGVHRYLQRLEA